MIIRRATLSDAPQMCDILNEIIEIGGTTAYQTPREPDYFTRVIAADGAFTHVAEIDGQITAYQWITPLMPPHLAQIATFARPGTVQRGIGSALFPHTQSAARAAGYKEIDATIRGDNTGGLAYYSKMGFQDVGVTKGQPLTDGTKVDRIHKIFTL
jgi:L-amino acid N-acyltransferase YncA